MEVSPLAKVELQWWVTHVSNSFNYIHPNCPVVVMNTDASNDGWGAVSGGVSTGGHWNSDETSFHINVLELKAVFLGVRSFFDNLLCHTHIEVYVDNTTAVSYINEMAEQRNIWITACFVPGSDNTVADKASRVLNDLTEWSLDSDIFDRITVTFGKPEIDLFASRLNNKVVDYVSWRPDPGAKWVDSFTVDWNGFFFYAFPPFSLIGRCLQKIRSDCSTGIMVVPLWTTQHWMPSLMSLVIERPLVLPLDVVSLPFSGDRHPLKQKMRLMACVLSGDLMKGKEFRRRVSVSSCNLGATAQNLSIEHILTGGYVFVTSDRLIPVSIMRKQ